MADKVTPEAGTGDWYQHPALPFILALGSLIVAFLFDFWPVRVICAVVFALTCAWFAWDMLSIHTDWDARVRVAVIAPSTLVLTALLAIAVIRHSVAGATATEQHTANLATERIVIEGQFVRMQRGTRPDNLGKIIFPVPLVNLTQNDLNVTVYSDVQIEPFIPVTADDAAVKNQILTVKDEVRAKFHRHFTEAITVMPGSTSPGGLNSTVEVPGPYVTDSQWNTIKNGGRYVYVYVLAAINDDPADSPTYCGIANSVSIPPMGCAADVEKW